MTPEQSNSKNAKKINISAEPPKKHKRRGIWQPGKAGNDKSKTLLANLAELVLGMGAEAANPVLDLQIRDGYVSVYYRGGSLWKIKGFRTGRICFSIDKKYWRRADPEKNIDVKPIPENKTGAISWINKRLWMQEVMDGWFKEHEKPERELQHKLCTNHLHNHTSGWIVLDLEYAVWMRGTKNNKGGSGRRLCRFDYVAFQRSDPGVLFLVELKLTQRAMLGGSGALSHAEDFCQFLKHEEDQEAYTAFRESMRRILREKSDLQLLPGCHANGLLKNDKWPDVIQPIFCLDADAALALGSATVPGSLRTQVEEKLKGLYSGTLWFDTSFNPISAS